MKKREKSEIEIMKILVSWVCVVVGFYYMVSFNTAYDMWIGMAFMLGAIFLK